MKGKLILVVGPSGSGKSVLLAHVRREMPEIVFPTSCTTRAMRPGEVEGKIYYFVSPGEFQKRIERGDFLEWAVYGGNHYGTLKAQILPAIEEGKTVVREVEVQGARQIKEIMPPERLSIIFIDGGSWDELESRIVSRAPIGDAELVARKKRYEDERSFMKEATRIVKNPNGELERAKKDFVRAVQELSK